MTPEIRAYCFSDSCNNRKQTNNTPSNSDRIEKPVKRGTFYCPDCNNALWWGKPPAPHQKIYPQASNVKDR